MNKIQPWKNPTNPAFAPYPFSSRRSQSHRSFWWVNYSSMSEHLVGASGRWAWPDPRKGVNVCSHGPQKDLICLHHWSHWHCHHTSLALVHCTTSSQSESFPFSKHSPLLLRRPRTPDTTPLLSILPDPEVAFPSSCWLVTSEHRSCLPTRAPNTLRSLCPCHCLFAATKDTHIEAVQLYQTLESRTENPGDHSFYSWQNEGSPES